MREKFLHERAVVLGRHKLISDLDGRKRFYVRKGLLEEVPEQEVDPLNRARLEDALETFLREVGRPTDAPPRRMSDETRDELKSLGYIE